MPRRLVLLVPILVFSGGWIALGRLAMPVPLLLAAVAALGFAVAGAAIHERRAFLVYAGIVTGTMSAMIVGGVAVLAGLVACAALASALARSDRSLGAHGVLAALAAFPLWYGAQGAGRGAEGVLPWALAAWIVLVRELVRDLELERAAGSDSGGRVAMTATLALAFVPVSLVWPSRASYHGGYFLIVLFAELAVIAAATRLLVGRRDGLSAFVTGAMGLGLIALVVGRIA